MHTDGRPGKESWPYKCDIKLVHTDGLSGKESWPGGGGYEGEYAHGAYHGHGAPI